MLAAASEQFCQAALRPHGSGQLSLVPALQVLERSRQLLGLFDRQRAPFAELRARGEPTPFRS
ncbi:hypothetical protein MOTC310_26445 [Methylobacterium oryzae]|uniref:Uncharacterized protein n=1 Tax=Methylobacterium oryzae TaxID=334852 RepID=A0ABU7TW37_9HYPH